MVIIISNLPTCTCSMLLLHLDKDGRAHGWQGSLSGKNKVFRRWFEAEVVGDVRRREVIHFIVEHNSCCSDQLWAKEGVDRTELREVEGKREGGREKEKKIWGGHQSAFPTLMQMGLHPLFHSPLPLLSDTQLLWDFLKQCGTYIPVMMGTYVYHWISCSKAFL